MLLWIVIFSFFESSDFNDEVVVLFGNVPFWTCVVISVVVALGELLCIEVLLITINCLAAPRFLVKFISTSYLPLDRDIVREMWVYGDLKDRLGIKHRRDRKEGDIEVTPMFHHPHARSQSEVSVLYENEGTSTTQPYTDSPPQTTQRTQTPPSQPPDSWALRQRAPNDATSPTTTVGATTAVAYTQARSTPPNQTTQSMPVSSYEMQVRQPQEPTDNPYQAADDDWELEPRSRSLTPDDRHTPGRAI